VLAAAAAARRLSVFFFISNQEPSSILGHDIALYCGTIKTV